MLEQLLSGLRSDDPQTRRYTVNQIAQTKDERAQEILVNMLGDPEGVVRWSAAVGLYKYFLNPRIVQPFVRLLNDSDVQAKAVVIRALGELRDPSAVEPLINVLKGHSPLEGYGRDFWQDIVNALEKIGTPEALTAVAESKKHHGK